MTSAITDITGIGPAAATALAEHGFKNLKALARASVEQVSAVPGFSTARAQKVIAAATELLADSTEMAAAAKPEVSSINSKDKKKKDKKKKGKKGGKDKKKKKKKKNKK